MVRDSQKMRNNPPKEWFKPNTKRINYRISVFILVIIGALIGHYISEGNQWLPLRYKIHRLMRADEYPKPRPQHTTLVLINDEDYWKGELARRNPIKRNYIAKLLRVLDKGDPMLLALDFQFRSPVANGELIEHPDYTGETKELLDTIKEIARNRPVVMPAVLWENENGKDYVLDSSIYSDFDFGSANVLFGYINLPYDIRLVPPPIELEDGNIIRSFSMIIAEAKRARDVERLVQFGSHVYGNFIPKEEDFMEIYAGDVFGMTEEQLRKKIGHNIVIISGSWSRFAYQRGDPVDSYETPIGKTLGSRIHANYVESILSGRTWTPWPTAIVVGIEVFLAFLVAILFALEIHAKTKVLTIIGLCIALLLFTYLLADNLGVYFEFVVPAFFIVFHAFMETIKEWRDDALKLRSIEGKN